VSLVETSTRVLRPSEVTADALSGLRPEAATLVNAALSAETARPISPARKRAASRHNAATVAYRGRHREPVERAVSPAEPVLGELNWVAAPPAFADPVQEKTAALMLVDVPLPARQPGAALHAAPAPPPARAGLRGLLASLLRGVR